MQRTPTTKYFLFFVILILLWPIFIIVLFVTVLWRELNCVKIPQCDANKSTNRLDIYEPKMEQYQLQSFTCLAHGHIKIHSSHRFAHFFLYSTILNIWPSSYKNTSNPPTFSADELYSMCTNRNLFQKTSLQKCGKVNNSPLEDG